MASNRTLLANLGFNDPDKSSKKHDLGCHFLVQPHIIEKITKNSKNLFFPTKDILFYGHTHDKDSNKSTHLKYCANGKYIINTTLNTEVPITKGENQYKQTIGFIDGIIETVIFRESDEYQCENNESHRSEEGKCIWKTDFTKNLSSFSDWKFFVEIKITPQKVGDIIRQINLYREYLSLKCYYGSFILAYNFDLSEIEIKALEKENIICIKLGKQFDDWCVEQLNIKSEQKENRLEF